VTGKNEGVDVKRSLRMVHYAMKEIFASIHFSGLNYCEFLVLHWIIPSKGDVRMVLHWSDRLQTPLELSGAIDSSNFLVKFLQCH
jgi:hypothetical protein